MAYRFVIADVFSARAFGGNQLAVLPDARGLSDRAMQTLAREFNFAESTFVLPPTDPGNTRLVRIFNPKSEMPFAGHPTVGTAAVLVHLGLVETRSGEAALTLEEGIGPVAVAVRTGKAGIHARFTVTQAVERPADAAVDRTAAAAALSLKEDAVNEAWFAGIGPRFCFVHLGDNAAVDAAQIDRAKWSASFAASWAPNMHLFAGDLAPGRLYARMFAPALGVEEDPATGSAAATLASCLAERQGARDGTFAWSIDQGVAMGRPSVIDAEAVKRGGRVVEASVGGYTVPVAEGEIDVAAGA